MNAEQILRQGNKGKELYVQSFLSGLTNTVTAVKNAQMAESPVLLIGGAAATLLKVLLSEQEFWISFRIFGL